MDEENRERPEGRVTRAWTQSGDWFDNEGAKRRRRVSRTEESLDEEEEARAKTDWLLSRLQCWRWFWSESQFVVESTGASPEPPAASGPVAVEAAAVCPVV